MCFWMWRDRRPGNNQEENIATRMEIGLRAGILVIARHFQNGFLQLLDLRLPFLRTYRNVCTECASYYGVCQRMRYPSLFAAISRGPGPLGHGLTYSS